MMRNARHRSIMSTVQSDGAAFKASGSEKEAEDPYAVRDVLLSTRPGFTFQEGEAKRLQWEYPEGANVVAEYCLETEAPRVIAVMEAESMEPFGQRYAWTGTRCSR